MRPSRYAHSDALRAGAVAVVVAVILAALTLDLDGSPRSEPAPRAEAGAAPVEAEVEIEVVEEQVEQVAARARPRKTKPKSAKQQVVERARAVKKLARVAQKKADYREDLLVKLGRVPVGATAPTSVRISSFNILGAGHTAPGGNRPGWAGAVTRMQWQLSLLQLHDVDVVGFQEFQPPQYASFMASAGSQYGVYPGPALGPAAMANSIAWRLDKWELVSSTGIDIPYFGGNPIKMPLVLLKNRQSGRQIYFANFHNPADAHGPAQGFRNQATQIQVKMVNDLRATTGLPVFITGDMNDREEYFCPMTTLASMKAANGGGSGPGACAMPPKPWQVDWIFGSPEVTFSNYVADRSPLVARSTDHPMIVADATVAAAVGTGDCYPVRKGTGWVPCPGEGTLGRTDGSSTP
ncbi:endonuclease/exonuclease/phosphatase family protein [uncultured Nocardioides sp.]|uniref:endonuclease/exonuclease/phosphatase family protein n=1 Tax=uncultured Nocardioides sp. TaxID=198441 RepID=UPI0025EDAF79|nr:endonuclease/exonuclease/phosphatase family protein [uncultured Nocardioides sp.]